MFSESWMAVFLFPLVIGASNYKQSLVLDDHAEKLNFETVLIIFVEHLVLKIQIFLYFTNASIRILLQSILTQFKLFYFRTSCSCRLFSWHWWSSRMSSFYRPFVHCTHRCPFQPASCSFSCLYWTLCTAPSSSATGKRWANEAVNWSAISLIIFFINNRS